MADVDKTLLQTKLHRPRVPHDLVERARLVEWLNDGIDHPITLVCAPAGYGKTTLICTWLERMAACSGEKTTSLPHGREAVNRKWRDPAIAIWE